MANVKGLSVAEAAPKKPFISKNAVLPIAKGAIGAAVGLVLVLAMASYLNVPVGGGTSGSTTQQMDKAAAAVKTLDYINTYLVPSLGAEFSANLIKVDDYGNSLYVILFSLMNGDSKVQDINAYITKDGKNMFISNAFDLDTPLEVPEPPADTGDGAGTEISSCDDAEKTGTPAFDVFVVSRCPYGIQSMNGLVSVAELLGEKATITVRYISTISPDGSLSAMHGAAELEENRRQVCMREEQPDKFWHYIGCYVETDKSAECEATAEINPEELSACVAERSTGYLTADASWGGTSRSGLSSPTFFLNGKKINENSQDIFDRSPEGLKKRICCGMAAMVEECSEELLTTVPPAGFGKIGDTQATSGGNC